MSETVPQSREWRVERTGGWLFRYRVVYPTDGGLDLETIHFTRWGAYLHARVWANA